MKKLLSIAMASLAVAALADPPANTASPTIGVTAITTSLQNTIVSVPFKSLNGGEDIAVTDLVCSDGFEDGDWLYVFKNNQYYSWCMASGVWTATANASTSGVVIDSLSADAQKTVASPGAIWVVFKTAPNPSKTFYIFGQYDQITGQTLTPGAANLVANPLQCAGYVTVTNPAKGDVISIPNDTANPDTYTYSYKKSLQAYRWVKNDANRTSTETLANIEFGAGRGFWYVSKGENAPSISWTKVN